MNMVQSAGRKKEKSENKWTTICIDRQFKKEIERKEMTYGDSWDSFLKSQLEINKED